MLKIAYITTSLDYGGAETHVVQLALRLKSRGWDVMIVSMLAPKAYVEELEKENISVHSLEMNRGVPGLGGLLKLISILKMFHPHVAHSHMVHANLCTRICRIFVPIPVLISTAHSMIEGARWREIAYRITDGLADLTTNVSQAAVNRYIQVGAVPRSKIRCMPNGVATQRFVTNKDIRERTRNNLDVNNRFVWLAVGRFEEAKDYPNMLQAFSNIVAHPLRPLLLIAGRGPLQSVIEDLILKMHLNEHVKLLGIRRDIPFLMNAADAYIMSSIWEGLPMVLLEAGAAGLPIVATDVGGNGEIVINNKSGFLVPPKNSEALSFAITKVMTMSSEDRHRFGQNGRKHILERYDLDRVADRWETLYREALSTRKRKR